MTTKAATTQETAIIIFFLLASIGFLAFSCTLSSFSLLPLSICASEHLSCCSAILYSVTGSDSLTLLYSFTLLVSSILFCSLLDWSFLSAFKSLILIVASLTLVSISSVTLGITLVLPIVSSANSSSSSDNSFWVSMNALATLVSSSTSFFIDLINSSSNSSLSLLFILIPLPLYFNE